MSTLTPQNGAGRDSNNVVDLFSKKTFTALQDERIIRLSPEHDGMSMLYSNSTSGPEKLYAMKILCWGLRENGEVVGMVPWLNKVVPCDELTNEQHGQYEGYYDIGAELVFSEPPAYKVLELQNAANYFEFEQAAGTDIIQEIPDTIGTHAMLNAEDSGSIILTEVLSWRLLYNGVIEGMLINEEQVSSTPVLPGDSCLYPANENPDFRYFFQHHIANQIKAEDPEALAAISLLFEES
ncbi:hypothetical protein [Oceanicoccus sagamiensis]|uniref:Uncharacterized protein n=1 Tax=Oceanicoccus sagamiensis TaxID=716816 RepID=A0A1X9NKC4_9GAMM|nr:hypothetical protein [Oceanicoccus sagamiensis]ARN75899.1 hypothetical protein BST96_18425 [Oceanicoccus sagamiensis]